MGNPLGNAVDGYKASLDGDRLRIRDYLPEIRSSEPVSVNASTFIDAHLGKLLKTEFLDCFRVGQGSIVPTISRQAYSKETKESGSARSLRVCIARFSAVGKINSGQTRRFASPHQLQSELNLAGSSGSGGNHSGRG